MATEKPPASAETLEQLQKMIGAWDKKDLIADGEPPVIIEEDVIALRAAVDALRRLQSTEQERDRHDCQRWHEEGLGCAQCNPAAIASRNAWEDDPIRKELGALKQAIAALQREKSSEQDRRVAAQEAITHHWQPRAEAAEQRLRDLEQEQG